MTRSKSVMLGPAWTVRVCRGFQPDVREVDLPGVLDGDDLPGGVEDGRQGVEEGGLARGCHTRDDDEALQVQQHPEVGGEVRAEGSCLDELGNGEGLAPLLPDAEAAAQARHLLPPGRGEPEPFGQDRSRLWARRRRLSDPTCGPASRQSSPSAPGRRKRCSSRASRRRSTSCARPSPASRLLRRRCPRSPGL